MSEMPHLQLLVTFFSLLVSKPINRFDLLLRQRRAAKCACACAFSCSHGLMFEMLLAPLRLIFSEFWGGCRRDI